MRGQRQRVTILTLGYGHFIKKVRGAAQNAGAMGNWAPVNVFLCQMYSATIEMGLSVLCKTSLLQGGITWFTLACMSWKNPFGCLTH